MADTDLNFLKTLETIIQDRRASPVAGSYTAELFAAGSQRIAQKVGEEAIEVALASCHGDTTETKAETADLLYHLLVLLSNQDIKLSDVVAVLEDRHAQ
ncbi:MAG: phosphoribosyl-ATP diphosphatase [Woeseiaceae bacterium]